MATILSTKTSGVGGLTVTGDASGVLQLASGNGTTAVTIDASQNVTFANSLTSPTLVSPALGTVASGDISACTGTATSLNAGIGVGQTWQAFTVGTQRVSTTVYYNTTGKPISISIIGGSNSVGNYLTLSVDSKVISRMYLFNSAGIPMVTAIIPAGSSYSCDVSAVAPSWFELR
jgi:hypothetical protein